MNGNEQQSTTVRSAYTSAHVVIAVVGTVIVAWILSFIYGVAEHYSPLVYLNLILAFGFGWLVGRAGVAFLKKFRINNIGAATLVGVIGGLCAVYLAWPAYFWVITGYNFEAYTDTIASPGLIWEMMGWIAEDPRWTIGKSDMPSILYFAIWLGELILIVGVVVVDCRKLVEESLLCDKCLDWVVPSGDFARFAIPSEDQPVLIAALSAGDISRLPSLGRVSDEEASGVGEWLEVKGFACPNCHGVDEYVTVALVMVQAGKKENSPERSEKVLARLVRVDVETERLLFEPAPDAEKAADEGDAGNG